MRFTFMNHDWCLASGTVAYGNGTFGTCLVAMSIDGSHVVKVDCDSVEHVQEKILRYFVARKEFKQEGR